MPERARAMDAFLDAAGWGTARRAPLAGDASNRRYLRLTDPETGQTAVLMDAPAERGEDVGAFTRIARHLAGLGLSAPAILAEDAGFGFLLLEDLGDALFARVVEADPGRESELYAAATDALVALHRHRTPAGLPAYEAPMLGDLAALALDWYGPAHASADARAAFADTVNSLCRELAPETHVLALRDYHAENLVWLPGRSGAARVGLLDFQDARAGHPAYDLVSLLQDARRDVPAALQDRMRARYRDAAGLAHDGDFDGAYAVLGAQRNLRIIGVFARLCLRDGKPRYLDHLPRVWRYLEEDLAHPALGRLRDAVAAHLPPPTTPMIESLRQRCASVPIQ